MTIKRLLISAIAAVGVSLTAHAQPTELSIMAPAAPGRRVGSDRTVDAAGVHRIRPCLQCAGD